DAKQGSYTSVNEEWRSLYNATAVVPVMRCAALAPFEKRVIGFLCVDNKGGVFTDETVADLRLVALELACIVDRVTAYAARASPVAESKENPAWAWFRPVLEIFSNRTDRLDRKRNAAHECLDCGYSLQGNVSGFCPECGRPTNQRNSQH